MFLPTVILLEIAEKEINNFVDPVAIDIARERIGSIKNNGIEFLRKAGKAEYMPSDKLDEIKIKGNDTEFRMLGSILTRQYYIILHAFQKKSKKIKQRDKEIAKKRKKEALNYL